MQRLWLYCGLVATLLVFSLSTAQAQGMVGPCQVFPADNIWNRDISADPVHPQSAQIIAHVNTFDTRPGHQNVHPDWGNPVSEHYGMPWITVDNSQPALDKSDITFDYEDESDNSPYPVPYDAPIEGKPGEGGDRHVLVINTSTCVLSELYAGEFTGDSGDGVPNTWDAGSGAVFDLNSNALRTDGWTSADAAGLPVFPGLARCDEASAGPDGIQHTLRFTIKIPRGMYVFPGRHKASNSTDTLTLPYGARLRLKADYPESGLEPQALAVVRALKRYGMFMADGGSNWYISGDYPATSYDSACSWDDASIEQLKDIPSVAFEVLAYPGNNGPALNTFATLTPTLTWGRLTWASAYDVQVSTTSTFTAHTDYNNVQATSVVVTVPNQGQYFFRVRGRDSTGTTGAWSATGTFNVAILN